jgi:hypothetical protein
VGLVTKPHTFTPSTTVLSSEVNANFDAIYNVVNGNIEAANIASGAVGEAELAANAVTNSKVSSSAAIALSKLAALTVSKAAVTDASGVLTTSAVTATELGHLAGVTSAIQTQLTALDTDKLNAADYTAADVLTKVSTVDGTGSGLDSDKVDGCHVFTAVWQPSGTLEFATGGLTVVKASTGTYTVTHNFGTSQYSPIVSIGAISTDRKYATVNRGTNTMTVRCFDQTDSFVDANVILVIARPA